MSKRRLRDDALAIWSAGVAAVHAGRLVRAAVRRDGDVLVVGGSGRPGCTLALDDFRRVAVVGAGKATAAMAAGLEQALGADLLAAKNVSGWVNVPNATVAPLERVHVHGARKLPDNRPTEEGAEGARRILEIARSLSEDDLLFVLLSGGGSALLPLPAEGVTLAEKLRVTALLQERGAAIGEMNCVRKHLSQVKGGRLAEATKARVVTLAVSDVIGDPLDVIASGPTAPDPTTFQRAMTMLHARGILDATPASVRAHLERGCRGEIGETPKTLDSARVTNVVIGGNAEARQAALQRAVLLGYAASDVGCVEGETSAAARGTAEAIRKSGAHRVCLVQGGETTVALPAVHGKGGRNQEFALSVLAELGAEGLDGACVLSGGTDGEDGPTDAAGAVADADVARQAAARGLDPREFLERHDAYRFFDPLGALVRTGFTATNVMDLRIVLIDRMEGTSVAVSEEPARALAEAKPAPR